MQKDFLLGEDNEDIIVDGDFLTGNADNDNVELLLELPMGHIRHFPLAGCGILVNANSIITYTDRDKITQQLSEDGYAINAIYNNPLTKELVIDFQ